MAQEEIGHRDELISEYSLAEISRCLMLVIESSVNPQVLHVLEFGAFLFLSSLIYIS